MGATADRQVPRPPAERAGRLIESATTRQLQASAAITLDTMNTGHVPDIDPKTATGQQAHDYMIDQKARIWPGLTA